MGGAVWLYSGGDVAAEYLIMIEGASVGRRVEIAGGPMTLGRDAGNDIPLDDTQASRRHAQLGREGGSLVIQDLGSTNGTFVNEERIAGPRALRTGDRIRIGHSVFDLRADAAATEIETPAVAPPPPAAPPPPPPPAPAPAAAAPPPAPPPPPPLARPNEPHGYPEPPPAQRAAGWEQTPGQRIPGQRNPAEGIAGLKSDAQARMRAYIITFVVLLLVLAAVIVFAVTR
jgi:hypothetical protein